MNQNGLGKIANETGYERLEDFLDNASVGIHLVGNDGTIIYANKTELELLGFSSEEYIGHNKKRISYRGTSN